ncbi:hypothetical protein ACWPKO_22910 (plasmid) [Coraliomargarita sp. W4R53]
MNFSDRRTEKGRSAADTYSGKPTGGVIAGGCRARLSLHCLATSAEKASGDDGSTVADAAIRHPGMFHRVSF